MSSQDALDALVIPPIDELRGNTKAFQALLDAARERYSYQTYYRNEALRSALFELYEHIPEIPKPLVKILQGAGRERRPAVDFLEAWRNDGSWEPPIDKAFELSDFFAFCEAGATVIEPFARSNLHNSAYFYRKALEWFVSTEYLKPLRKSRIVDIGAAYFGFGKIIEPRDNVQSIDLVDLEFQTGVHPRTDKVNEIGTSAADLSHIADASRDLVVLHNAFEHFAHGADARCIKEVGRILKPGGKALISPFFFASRYSISINPISAFLFQKGRDLYPYIMSEYRRNGASIRFSKGMLSPYARIFDFRAFKDAFPELQDELRPTLIKAVFAKSKPGSQPRQCYGIEFRDEFFSGKPFYYLEILKPR